MRQLFPEDPRFPTYGLPTDSNFFMRLVQRLEEWARSIAEHVNEQPLHIRASFTAGQSVASGDVLMLTPALDGNEVVQSAGINLTRGAYLLCVNIGGVAGLQIKQGAMVLYEQSTTLGELRFSAMIEVPLDTPAVTIEATAAGTVSANSDISIAETSILP